MPDQEFTRALYEFEQSLQSKELAALDLCGLYKKIKPILVGILPFLKLLPSGPTIVAAITALMAILDKTCPGS